MIGGRSSDMERTLAEAAKAREDGIHIIVIGIGTWINVVELAGVASYPYQATRLLLPAGYRSLSSIRDRLRDMICNSESKLQSMRFCINCRCNSYCYFNKY